MRPLRRLRNGWILATCSLLLAGCESSATTEPPGGAGGKPKIPAEDWEILEDAPQGPEGPEGPVVLVNADAGGNALVRFDVEGNQVDAHGGEIRRFGELYYLYGETYGCGFEWQKLSPTPFCGYRVYTSPNLTDWTDRGLLFDVSGWEPWQKRCYWFSNGCFRPHVVYNRGTGKYVLWVNVYDRPVSYYVLESATPTGPFVERGVPRLAFNEEAAPGKVNNGDHNLFVDEDGTGYIIYTEWAQGQGDMVIEQLTPDYLNGTGKYVRLGVRATEAPSMFKREGRYYVTLGDPNCAYCATGTYYFTASSPLGPWSRGKRISANSCGGQPGHVSELPTAEGGKWYLYQSDLWLNSDGVGGGDKNQAPAPQFWAPLEFDARGEIRPITCRSSYRVNAWTASPPNPEPPASRLRCDIGTSPEGRVARELTVEVAKEGRLRSVSVPVYQRGEPDIPLIVELRGGDGSVLDRVQVAPNGPGWDVPVNISWAARRLRVAAHDTPVRAGESVSVRLSTESSRGCYGFAFRDGVEKPAVSSRVSTDGGKTWRAEAGREPRLEVEIR
jgi:hypothetical protein